MTFQIEQILLLKNKAYLLTRSLNDNIRFKLSDNSLLGDFEIENWFDIPKAKDENGNYRKDNFAFVLKDKRDTERIKQGDILKLSDVYVEIVESFHTVSGVIGSVLECGTGMLDINTVLTYNEKKWKITKNNLLIGRQKDTQLQKSVNENFWFLYNLKPIGHKTKPEVGKLLRVTQNGC